MQYIIAKILYNIIWIPWHLVLRFFLHYQVIYQDTSIRNVRGPFIIIANHSSWMDPFIISGIFPIFSPVFPIRFAAYPKLFFNPFVGIFIYLLGTFPAQKGMSLAESLRKPISLLSKKQVVGIFPEGRRRRLGRPRKGRRGAAYLAIRTNAEILPIFIKGAIGINLKTFLLRKKHIIIYVGRTVAIPSSPDDLKSSEYLNKTTIFIMEKIQELNPSKH